MSAKAVKLTKQEMAYLVKGAQVAAIQAFAAASVTPMVVGTPKTAPGTGPFGPTVGLDETQPTYYEAEGPCGFAWVIVKPGGSRFARYLKDKGIARAGAYGGGVSIWYSNMGIPSSQSYERNYAAARAYAAVLREGGIRAYEDGRLD